jgi:hypothetical protein
MVIRYRYTEWDGTQEIPPLDPDDILNALTDDLMNFGDLQHALRNLLQRGMRNPMGDRTQGLRDLLQQLRQQRRQNLDRFNLSSAFEDIQKRLEQILDKERSTLDQRLGDALGDQQPGEQGEGAEGQKGADGEPGGEQSGGESGQAQAGSSPRARQSGSSSGGSPAAALARGSAGCRRSGAVPEDAPEHRRAQTQLP